MTLTKKQIHVMKNALEYNTRDKQINPLASESSLLSDALSLGVSTSVINGVYLSLRNKGYGYVIPNGYHSHTYFVLNKDGINAIFDYLEN